MAFPAGRASGWADQASNTASSPVRSRGLSRCLWALRTRSGSGPRRDRPCRGAAWKVNTWDQVEPMSWLKWRNAPWLEKVQVRLRWGPGQRADQRPGAPGPACVPGGASGTPRLFPETGPVLPRCGLPREKNTCPGTVPANSHSGAPGYKDKKYVIHESSGRKPGAGPGTAGSGWRGRPWQASAEGLRLLDNQMVYLHSLKDSPGAGLALPWPVHGPRLGKPSGPDPGSREKDLFWNEPSLGICHLILMLHPPRASKFKLHFTLSQKLRHS